MELRVFFVRFEGIGELNFRVLICGGVGMGKEGGSRAFRFHEVNAMAFFFFFP